MTLRIRMLGVALAAVLLVGLCAAAQVAAQGFPAGWTQADRSVKAAAPEQDREVTVTYYRHPMRLPGVDMTPLEFVRIPAGEVMLGERVLKLDKPLLIGACEVTQEQYKSIMGKNPSHYRNPNNPVEKVSPKDAQEFCRRLTAQGRGVTFRLPTEAEFEYAQRAGSTTRFFWGDSMRDDACWWGGNRGGRTHPVGQKLPNAFGLYDIAGNALEWATCKPNQDKEGSEHDGFILRGGPEQEGDWSLASNFRYSYPDVYKGYNGIGLRLVAELPKKEGE